MTNPTGIGVTGGGGYLGGAVLDVLRTNKQPYWSVPTPFEDLLATGIDCRSVVHCAGRLRGDTSARIWADNANVTAALVTAVRPRTHIVFPSSRAVTARMLDDYARSKRAAEILLAERNGPATVIRFSVLAGPAPRGVGRSFLSRMAESAARGSIRVPLETRRVDLVDVRDAAAVLAAASSIGPPTSARVSASSGALDLFLVADLVAECTEALTGYRPDVVRCAMPESEHPPPPDPESWQQILERYHLEATPAENTVRDTVRACVTRQEAVDGGS